MYSSRRVGKREDMAASVRIVTGCHASYLHNQKFYMFYMYFGQT